MWSLVQPSDCVVSSHVYSLVIVCCIWSLVQPGDCIVCGHLYSLVIVCCVRSVSFTQPQDRNQSAKNTQRVQSSKNRKKETMLFCFKLGKHAGAREKSNVCILDIHNGVV